MSRAIKALFQRCAGLSGGLISGNSEFPQFLILGLDKAGKTTLLYRLKIGQGWQDMDKDMRDMRTPGEDGKTEDPGYHYEEFNRLFGLGMWDVPGTEAMRHIWRIFYQSIKIHGVIFVVDGSEVSEERIITAKRNLDVLMNEDELRHACFCVIINRRESQAKQGKQETEKSGAQPAQDEQEEVLKYKLGLHDLHPTCKWRTEVFKINILDLKGESDANWMTVMQWAKGILSDPRGLALKL